MHGTTRAHFPVEPCGRVVGVGLPQYGVFRCLRDVGVSGSIGCVHWFVSDVFTHFAPPLLSGQHPLNPPVFVRSVVVVPRGQRLVPLMG